MTETMTAAAVMTLTEIEERFDDEWILVENPEYNQYGEFVRGAVLFHSVDRDEMDAALMRLRPKYATSLYTGPIPENICINL